MRAGQVGREVGGREKQGAVSRESHQPEYQPIGGGVLLHTEPPWVSWRLGYVADRVLMLSLL